MKSNAARFGVVAVDDDWHLQPVGLPHSRRNYLPGTVFLTRFPLPSNPAAPIDPTPRPPTLPLPPPTDGDPDMQTALAAIYKPTAGVTRPNPKTFALLPDGSVRHATGPDTGYAAWAKLPTFEILGDEHYDQCVELDAVYRAR